MEKSDVLIIGSGPAGLTAAIYATRAGLNTTLVTGMVSGDGPGGQLMTTTLVENYPGFAEGIQGPELMAQMKAQALRFGTRFIDDDVSKINFNSAPFEVFVGSNSYSTKTIIIATGASAVWLGLESETSLKGRGVSSCATCDGYFFRGKEVAVIGGGDTAMEEAIYLTTHASKVTVVHRSENFKASKIMLAAARSNPKIYWLTNTVVNDILGEKSVKDLELYNTKSQKTFNLAVDGVFVAIGHKPNTDFLKNSEYALNAKLNPDNRGYLIPVEHSMTAIPGVFIAGDVCDHRYRQAITAAADGCKAALDVQEFLTKTTV